jgi:hypothetical protein
MLKQTAYHGILAPYHRATQDCAQHNVEIRSHDHSSRALARVLEFVVKLSHVRPRTQLFLPFGFHRFPIVDAQEGES